MSEIARHVRVNDRRGQAPAHGGPGPDLDRHLCRGCSVVAPDATYVSLNTENAELSKIMPWADAGAQ